MSLAREVHKNFNIKITGRNYIGRCLDEIVTFRRLAEILEDEGLAKRICEKALESKEDTFERRLRRGLKIKFYTK